MYNFAIRADGGPAVGMGHIMRCLAVAGELKSLGCRVYFISKYKQGIDMVSAKGFEAFKLSEDYENTDNRASTGFFYGSATELDDDIKETSTIVVQQGCDLLLVDKYNLTPEYFDKLKSFVTKVAFIDDLSLFKCHADIIINGNINALSLGYEKSFVGQKLLLGTRFTPLRKEFMNIHKREIHDFTGHKDKCAEIMITTGGADPYNFTRELLKILLASEKSANIKYNVIVSSGSVHKNQIQKMAELNTNIVLYIDYKCLSEVMLKSDLAISSGGSTLYELCCCGTPTLAFLMAENQKGIVETLSGDDYVKSLGWYYEIENVNIAELVSDLLLDFNKRQMYSQKMQSLIDGKGAHRIAQEILNKIKK